MKKILLTAAASLIAAGTAIAQDAGDPAAGEKTFKKCKSCHTVVDPDGNVIVKGGKTGPNLYGVVGRQAGTYPEFKYGDSIVALGETGFVWTPEEIAKYVVDPKAYLIESVGEGAKSKMTFKLKKGGEDVAAWLATQGAAMEGDGS